MAVDSVGQTDNHFEVIHVDVPIGVIGKKAEGSVSVLFVRDTIILYRSYLAEHLG